MNPPSLAAARAPALLRRLACGVSELVLLFGVVMMSAYLYSSLTQQRHALLGRHGLMVFLFLVLGLYFVWFWTHGGQTVAMKAWHVRLLGADGQPARLRAAVLRYVLSYVWVLPSLGLLAVSGAPRSGGLIFAALLLNVAVWALLALLHPRRQFWHDAIARTQLVDWRPPPAPRLRAARQNRPHERSS